MASDIPEILTAAEKLGALVSQHPVIARYKDAQRTVGQDPEASRLMGDFGKQIESLSRQEQSGMPITDAQRTQLESLQSRIASNLKVKALNLAEFEFTDLLRKVSQTWQKPVAEISGGGVAARPQIALPACGGLYDEALMGYWLLKTEPSSYSWDDLVREKKTVWEGVSNAAALKNIRSMKQGDLAFVYHTGNERQVIGIAKIASDAYPDPKQKDERLAVVDLKPMKKLARPVTLDAIKSDPIFAGWDLLRIGRLSVVPVPPAMWKRIEKLASG